MEPVGFPAPEDERAELFPSPRPPREADDREIVFQPELQLLPLGRPPAGTVRRVGALRDDALETLVGCRLQQRRPVLEGGRQAHGVGSRVEDVLEEPSSLRERTPVDRLPVQHEQVEDHQDEPPGARLQ